MTGYSLGRDLTKRLEVATADAGVFARGQIVEDPITGEVSVAIGGSPVRAHALGTITVEIGDPVLCVRVGTQWYVLDTITESVDLYVPPAPPAVAPAPAPTNPKPAQVQEGWSNFTAVESRTWSITDGQWNNFHGNHLVQGTWGGRSYSGFWWYGTAPRDSLAGRTALETHIWLPPRYRLGNYNAPATVHLILHDQSNRGGRPGGLAGPHDVVLQPGFAGGWVRLPDLWGNVIINEGGGIGIQGDPYAGLIGVGPVASGLDPMSGQLKTKWSRAA